MAPGQEWYHLRPRHLFQTLISTTFLIPLKILKPFIFEYISYHWYPIPVHCKVLIIAINFIPGTITVPPSLVVRVSLPDDVHHGPVFIWCSLPKLRDFWMRQFVCLFAEYNSWRETHLWTTRNNTVHSCKNYFPVPETIPYSTYSSAGLCWSSWDWPHRSF